MNDPTFSNEMLEVARLIADQIERRVAEDAKKQILRPVFLTEQEAAALCGLTHRSLQQMRYDGSGPPFVKLGTSQKAPVRYDRTDLYFWLHTRPRYRSTREAMGGVDVDEDSGEL